MRATLVAGIGLVIAGTLLGFLRHGVLPTATVALGALPVELLRLDAAAWLTLGILVFLAAPPLAVAYLAVSFARAGDRLHALMAGSVLALLLSSLATVLLEHHGLRESFPPLLALAPEAGVLAAAAVAGALGATLGLGGGVFIVPILTLFFGIPLKTSIAASAVAVVVNSLGGTTIYLRHHMTNVRLAMFMELTTVAGAVIGGLIVVVIAPNVLRGFFGLALLGLGIGMLFRPRLVGEERSGEDPMKLRGAFFDPLLGGEVAYVPQRLGLGAASGMLAGVVSGMLGIGGGVIKMPLLHTVMRVPVKAAAATSMFMVGITVSAGAYVYYAHDLVDLSVAAPAIIGIQLGSSVGANAARRIRSVTMVRYLVVILLYLGAVLLLQALGIHVPGVAPTRGAPL